MLAFIALASAAARWCSAAEATAIGRWRSWARLRSGYVASNDGAEVNTLCTTLIASCHLHEIEPEAYLRDLLCLLPGWPKNRVLELAPCNWQQTLEQPETQQRLAAHVMRRTILELDKVHSPRA